MSEREDFNKLVDMAMDKPGLNAMRPVVEKELLHYEIFQALDREGLLKDIVFQGGTALRLCRGSDRFSEDLDFAGGVDFSIANMDRIKGCVEKRIGERFGLKVEVRPKPAKDDASRVKVDKWWISIETAAEHSDMPRQKIKLEISNVPARTRELLPLLANYDSVRAMPTVMVQTESLVEIMADKILAFPSSTMRRFATETFGIWLGFQGQGRSLTQSLSGPRLATMASKTMARCWIGPLKSSRPLSKVGNSKPR